MGSIKARKTDLRRNKQGDAEERAAQLYEWLLSGWSKSKITRSINKNKLWDCIDDKHRVLLYKRAREAMQNSLEKYRDIAISDVVAKYHNLYSIAMEKVERYRDRADCNALYAAKTILNDISTLFNVSERLHGNERALSRDEILAEISSIAKTTGLTIDIKSASVIGVADDKPSV